MPAGGGEMPMVPVGERFHIGWKVRIEIHPCNPNIVLFANEIFSLIATAELFCAFLVPLLEIELKEFTFCEHFFSSRDILRGDQRGHGCRPLQRR